MRLAIISDIHGNLAAFEEVLADIDRQGVDGIMCLGDNIGYGPEPEGVVGLLQARGIPSIMGNHESALVEKSHLNWFNPYAKIALLLTERLLSRDTMALIQNLPPTVITNEYLFVHGCPPDQINTYLFELSVDEFKERFTRMREDMCFVGHTHELVLVSYGDGRVTWKRLGKGSTTLPEDHKHIVSVGSVGQPRDGNNNAKYVLWDDRTHMLDVRFVPYDIRRTADKIIAMGFPRTFADRLW